MPIYVAENVCQFLPQIKRTLGSSEMFFYSRKLNIQFAEHVNENGFLIKMEAKSTSRYNRNCNFCVE